jgi:hypothetical protein
LVDAVKNTKSILKDPKELEYEFDVVEIDDTVSAVKHAPFTQKGSAGPLLTCP